VIIRGGGGEIKKQMIIIKNRDWLVIVSHWQSSDVSERKQFKLVMTMSWASVTCAIATGHDAQDNTHSPGEKKWYGQVRVG
jgi:hypothetical protein